MDVSLEVKQVDVQQPERQHGKSATLHYKNKFYKKENKSHMRWTVLKLRYMNSLGAYSY